MSAEGFDPRTAALRYAASAEATVLELHRPPLAAAIAGDAVNAVVCGLVYVGDRLEELRRTARDRAPS